MPDKKLTDEKCKELLEYKAKVHCEMCDLKVNGCCITCTYNLIKQFLEIFNRLQAENKKLKDFATSKCEDCAGCTSWKCDCANIKAEAYKEFAERLKKVYTDFDEKHEQIFYAQLITAIDCLLIGMVGGENGEEG